jgi:hypothetical protein
MVSGCRLAHHSKIVSWPPEKILSTATAEPGENVSMKKYPKEVKGKISGIVIKS